MADAVREPLAPPLDPGPDSKVELLLRRFVQDGQDSKHLRSTLRRLVPTLQRDEEIHYAAVQKSLTGLAPDAVVLTNRRFILFAPRLLGGMSLRDYSWRDLGAVQLKESMLSATLHLEAVTGGAPIAVDSLYKDQARRAYSICREMVEHAREERRQLDLEAKRAAAGAVSVQQGTPFLVQSAPAPMAAAAPQDDASTALRTLKALHSEGLLTDGEFAQKKEEILRRL